MDRLDCNQQILEFLLQYISENPDVRFSQALFNLGIVVQADSDDFPRFWKDTFGEEPSVTLKRVKSRLETGSK